MLMATVNQYAGGAAGVRTDVERHPITRVQVVAADQPRRHRNVVFEAVVWADEAVLVDAGQ